LVTALAFGGNLGFDPTKDPILDPQGNDFRFTPPQGPVLPSRGYHRCYDYYSAPHARSVMTSSLVNEHSDRIQMIEPFKPYDGKPEQDVKILIKVRGKCSKSVARFEQRQDGDGTFRHIQLPTIYLQLDHGTNIEDISKISQVHIISHLVPSHAG
jgi:hypothetical protein